MFFLKKKVGVLVLTMKLCIMGSWALTTDPVSALLPGPQKALGGPKASEWQEGEGGAVHPPGAARNTGVTGRQASGCVGEHLGATCHLTLKVS